MLGGSILWFRIRTVMGYGYDILLNGTPTYDTIRDAILTCAQKLT